MILSLSRDYRPDLETLENKLRLIKFPKKFRSLKFPPRFKFQLFSFAILFPRSLSHTPIGTDLGNSGTKIPEKKSPLEKKGFFSKKNFFREFFLPFSQKKSIPIRVWPRQQKNKTTKENN